MKSKLFLILLTGIILTLVTWYASPEDSNDREGEDVELTHEEAERLIPDYSTAYIYYVNEGRPRNKKSTNIPLVYEYSYGKATKRYFRQVKTY